MEVELQFLCMGEGPTNNGISIEMENQCVTTKKGPKIKKIHPNWKKIVRNDFDITNVEWREQLRPMYAIFNARTQEYSIRVSYTKACFA